MDFNTITPEQEQEVKDFFREYGKGIPWNSYNGPVYDSNQPNCYGWDSLMNKDISVNAIKNKMREYARKINTECNDELLGEDQGVIHTFNDEFDNEHQITNLDCYTFLRAALRHRMNAAEYKAKVRRRNELKAKVDANKSLTEKKREWKAELKALEEELE